MGIKQSRQILQNQHSNNSKVQHTGDTTTSHSTSSVIIDGRAYHNVEKSTYILPRDELEQDRLNSVCLFYFYHHFRCYYFSIPPFLIHTNDI
jgi:hypothetical protein